MRGGTEAAEILNPNKWVGAAGKELLSLRGWVARGYRGDLI